MERLDTLQKIYEYGETLSSEEMNQIVSYINIIIEALNSLIRKNNGISDGHCEMRYILSPTQPQKPETGSDGFVNGWTDLYLLPERGSGNSTWMTICFVSGGGYYGEWSTPICLSGGTVTGSQGPKGDSGTKGSFISRVFKRQNIKPDTPIGGTYDNPVPEGWYDGVPSGTAIIWSSTSTFYGNGTHTAWSEPAQESDTTTLDIEFSPSQSTPSAPLGNTPFSNHESEGWYDPSSPNFNSVGTMIWRAERKVSNGEYDGDWTITKIYGEKGENGLRGETGGHYEFRYINFKATLEHAAPVKPADGTDGTSGGWQKEQQDLTELEIKEGTFTWMTQCYQDEYGVYGTWTDPIRITGANGIDGEDGSEQEFIYTRNNTGIAPPAPPTTQVTDWYGLDRVNNVYWTDDPMGVSDVLMWEYVSTRMKEGNIWQPYSTPVIWAKWGKQGKIGQMSYLAGVWDPNTTYTKTDEKSPVVYYNGNYYYIKGDINSQTPSISSTGQNPAQRPDVWAMADSFEMVFTDILFVKQFAKLASFIINEDWLISKHGTLYDSNGGAHEIDHYHSWNGHDVNEAYIYFDPSYPDSNKPGSLNFVPSIAIDSLSGRAFLWKGKFTGDVVANSLSLGSNALNMNNINGLSGALDNLSNGLNDKLPRSVGTPGDTYFNVSPNGLLTAENAVIYGDVFANRFRAGNPQGLNITVTGSSINFNYGSNTGAWFSTLDPNGNQSNSLYLYIKNPSTGDIYTLDFSNLQQVNSGGGSTAIQQNTYYSDPTSPSYMPNLFLSSTNNLYYSNSDLSTLYSGTLYQKVKTGIVICLIDGSGYTVQSNVGFFNKVVFTQGQRGSNSSDFYASATINGNLRSLYGSASPSQLTDSQISGLGSLGFGGTNTYVAKLQSSGSSLVKISRFEVEAGQNWQTLSQKEDNIMNS